MALISNPDECSADVITCGRWIDQVRSIFYLSAA